MDDNQGTQTSTDLRDYTAAVARLADYLKSIEGKPITAEVREQLKERQMAERQAKRQLRSGFSDSDE